MNEIQRDAKTVFSKDDGENNSTSFFTATRDWKDYLCYDMISLKSSIAIATSLHYSMPAITKLYVPRPQQPCSQS